MDNGPQTGRGVVWRRRLYDARFLLAGITFVLGLAVLAAPHIWWLAAAGFAFVVMVCLIAPDSSSGRKKTSRRRKIDDQPMERLSAMHLAGAFGEPLVIFDRGANIVFANEAAEEAFGTMQRGMAIEMKFRAPDLVDLVNEVMRTGRASLLSYVERVPFERWYSVSAIDLGEATGLYAVFFADRSESRRIEKMRSDFIANASHELRTPLASVAGFVETLRGPAKNDPKAQDRFLEIMQSQTERMARLIDDLLSLSRLESKTALTSADTVNLGTIVQSVTDSLRFLAIESGVEIDLTIKDGNLDVRGDRDELIQVFENLIENACKYGHSGGKVLVNVANTITDGRNWVEVSVRDFGPGISDEHIPRVTERFYRIDVEASRAQKGTGLGLSIVKHILTRHRGVLSIQSELSKGSTFTVSLPVASAKSGVLPPMSPKAEPERTAAPTPQRRTEEDVR